MQSIRFSHCLGTALLLGIIITLFSGPDAARAQDPRHWGKEGVIVRQGHHIEWQRATYRAEDGYVLATWSDTRTGDRDVYAQLIRPDGTQAWDEDGKKIIGERNRQEDPEPVRVTDGWIIAWIDFRNDSTGDIWAQKIDMDGNRMWADSGVLVDEFGSMVNEVTVRAVHDGVGGAIIAWEDTRGGDVADIYAMRIGSDGAAAAGWQINQPLAVTNIEGAQTRISADTDGDGNMILAWEDGRDPNNQNIYASEIHKDRSLPWGGVNGVPVCLVEGRQKSPKVCSDLESFGLYCAWVDERNAANHDLYMQHFDGDGNALWENNGLLLCGAPDKQGGVRIAVSMNEGAQDGCITVWEDLRENGGINEVYAQKTPPAGVHQWTAEGVLVCGDAGPDGTGNTREGARLTSDFAGGGLYVWADTRHANSNILEFDIWSARLDDTGSHLWGECGVRICGAANEQFAGVLRMIDDTRFLCVFNDKSRGSQTLRYGRFNVSDGSPLDGECGFEIVFGLDGDATHPEMHAMTSGRAGIVWRDNRGGNFGTALFYQVARIAEADSSPIFELPANGDTLVPDNGEFSRYDQKDHQLCSDGDAGFFVSFVDLRAGVKQVRLTRVDRDGEIACSRAGELVAESGVDQRNAFCVPDGAGGCFVAWSGFVGAPFFTLEIYVMRMDANCRPMWAEPVQLTEAGLQDDFLERLASNPDGCCIAVWQTGTFNQWDVASARVCSSGAVSWNQMICEAPREQLDATVIADGDGGAYYTWSDKRDQDFGKDIYAQHVNAAGDESWTHNGILVNRAAFDQKEPEIATDSENNVYVVWQDFRSGLHVDLYGQKVTPAGTLLWAEEGRALVGDDRDQYEHRLHVEWDDGLYGVWTDARGFYQAVYGTHIQADDDMAMDWWEEGHGGVIVDEFQNQIQPALADDGRGGILVCWVDWRSSGKEPLQNIWANWVNDLTVDVTEIPSVTLPTEYSLTQNYPNPFNPSTRFEFTIPGREHVEIALYNTLGRQVRTLVDEVMPAGSYRVNVEAHSLASGVYFYRLSTPSFQTVRKMTLVR